MDVKSLKKANRIIHYVGRAERRTNRFEQRVQKSIGEIAKELEPFLGKEFDLKDLITGFREITQELDVEQAHLIKYSSFYGSLLEEQLNKAAVEERIYEKIKEDNPKEAEKIHNVFRQLLQQIEEQLEDAERWVSALEGSLKKAQEILKKLPDGDKSTEGMILLERLGFPIKELPKLAELMARHPADISEIADAAGENAWNLFRYSFFSSAKFINEKNWPDIVRLLLIAGNDSPYLLQYGFFAVRELIDEKTGQS